jgi:Ca2+-dependent lipid-binding protein
MNRGTDKIYQKSKIITFVMIISNVFSYIIFSYFTVILLLGFFNKNTFIPMNKRNKKIYI